MHRSGTSLVASVLAEAGLDIGLREDVGLGVGQPRGHFEDRDFYHLHEAILAASGRSCFTADEASRDGIPPELEARARALVAARVGCGQGSAEHEGERAACRHGGCVRGPVGKQPAKSDQAV